jgi:hypothetical protein
MASCSVGHVLRIWASSGILANLVAQDPSDVYENIHINVCVTKNYGDILTHSCVVILYTIHMYCTSEICHNKHIIDLST